MTACAPSLSARGAGDRLGGTRGVGGEAATPRAACTAQAVFDAFDANADGAVDGRELSLGLAALHVLAASEAARVAALTGASVGSSAEAAAALSDALAALVSSGDSSSKEGQSLPLADIAAFLRAEELVRLRLTGSTWPRSAGAAGSNRAALVAALAPQREAAGRFADALVARLSGALGGSTAVPLAAFVRWHAAVVADRCDEEVAEAETKDEETPGAADAQAAPPLTAASIRSALRLAAFVVDDVASIFQEQCDAAARVGAGLDRTALQRAGGVDPESALVIPALTRAEFVHTCGLIAALGGGEPDSDAAPVAEGLFRVLDFDGDGKVSLGEVMAGGRWVVLVGWGGVGAGHPVVLATLLYVRLLRSQLSPSSCPAAGRATRRPRSPSPRLTAMVRPCQ